MAHVNVSRLSDAQVASLARNPNMPADMQAQLVTEESTERVRALFPDTFPPGFSARAARHMAADLLN